MLKYLVMPGWVRSRKDNGIHFVNAVQLMKLYKVNPDECFILQPGMLPEDFGMVREDMIILRPRYGGDYDLTQLQ